MSRNRAETVFSADVQLQIWRVCNGFRQLARLTIYDTIPLTGLLCCKTMTGKHYHVGIEANDEEATDAMIDAIMLSPDGAAERVLREVFDPSTAEERAQMEVTSRQRRYG